MKRRVTSVRLVSVVVLVATAVGTVLGFGSQALAGSTTFYDASPRVAGGTDQTQAMLQSPHSLSNDGRYVVYSSGASNITAGDTNSMQDVFVRDTQDNVTTRVSVSSDGTQADSNSGLASISYSGRYVVFSSAADNLVTGVSGTMYSHIYMHDMTTGETSIVDTSSGGTINDGSAQSPQVSADGRYVVFSATATNLVPGINSPTKDQIYIKDMYTGAIKDLSVTSAGVAANDDNVVPDISCDGNVVVFDSSATNLGVPSTPSGRKDVMVVDLGWGGDKMQDVTPGTVYGADPYGLQVSCDGNIILFSSSSTNVVSPATTYGYDNVYEYNRVSGSIMQASLGNGDVQADSFQQYKQLEAAMSSDGRYVVFDSNAHNMDTSHPDYGSHYSVFVRDMKKDTTTAVDILPSGDSSGFVGENSIISISSDGSVVAFPYTTPNTDNVANSLIQGYSTGSSLIFPDVYTAQLGY